MPGARTESLYRQIRRIVQITIIVNHVGEPAKKRRIQGGNTFEVEVRKAVRPEVAPSRADLGLTEEGRQFPHRVAFLCFAGDAVVAFACLLVAFWLRFDTALSDFGVEAPGIVLSSYSNYIIFGSLSLLLVLAQKQMYDGSWLLHRRSPLKDVIVACLVWGADSWVFRSSSSFSHRSRGSMWRWPPRTAMTGLYAWRRLFYYFLRQESIAGKLRQRILRGRLDSLCATIEGDYRKGSVAILTRWCAVSQPLKALSSKNHRRSSTD